MLRRITGRGLRRTIFGAAALLFGVATVQASVWPAQIGQNALKSEQPAQISSDQALWHEDGFVAATTADYGAFQATAYQFEDPTGAFAAEQSLKASEPGATLAGNYVVTCKGKCPNSKVLASLQFPKQRHDQAPLLWDYLPAKGLIAGSARYALGPVGLERFAPQIPASVVGFQYSPEVATGKYRIGRREQEFVLFYYPLPQMARPQAAEMENLPGAVVRRSGSLVGVILNPPDRAEAERFLSQIKYLAQVAWDQKPPPVVTAQSVAQMVLTILKLAGLLILFCTVAGFGYAGLRLLRKRLGPESADGAMILLHLADR